MDTTLSDASDYDQTVHAVRLQLVVDQNYTVADAASAMDVGLSTMTRWVKQLRDERQGKTPKTSPITPEQIEIRELRKKAALLNKSDFG